MNDFALALNATMHAHHAGRHYHTSKLFKDLWPNHEVGDARFIFERD